MDGQSKTIDLERFNAAVRVIQHLPKDGPFQPSNELKLKFYGYYKQATVGPCVESKPGFWDLVRRAKWDAWKSLGPMSKEEAMKSYVDCLKQVVETMSVDACVEDFLTTLGPFYEFVSVNGTREKASNSDSDFEQLNEDGVEEHNESEPQKCIPNGSLQTHNRRPVPGPREKEDKRSEENGAAAVEAHSEDEAFSDATDVLHAGDKKPEDDANTSPLGSHASSGESRDSSLLVAAKMERRNRRGRNVSGSGRENDRHEILLALDSIHRLERERRRRDGQAKTSRGKEDGADGSGSRRQNSSSGEGASRAERAGVSYGTEEGEMHRRSEGGSGSEGSSGAESPGVGWDPHVAAVLVRVHKELQGIRTQLDLMEALLLSQQRLVLNSLDRLNRMDRGFLSQLSWRSVSFIVIWPFIAHFLIRFCWLRFARRRF